MTKTYQLRRIGLPPSIEEVKNIYNIKDDTFIGRGKGVDVYVDSTIRKGLISRAHAHIVKRNIDGAGVFRIYDTSLNGTYVNDVRVKDFVVLNEGDKIAFGHLRGAIIEPGEYAPQKETEFLFKFESCIKKETDSEDLTKSSVLMSPDSLDSLPGLHETFNYGNSNRKSRVKCPKRILSEKEDDLASLVSSVTSNIKVEESSENEDLNLDIKPSIGPPKENDALVNRRATQLRHENTDSLFSSDNEIKRDTSLCIRHIAKDAVEPVAKEMFKEKVKDVLRDPDVGRMIEQSSHEKIIELSSLDKLDYETIQLDDEAEENIFSDKSEEITDSDSDYEPSVSKSPANRCRTRARRAPQRFSPVTKSAKKLKTEKMISPKKSSKKRKNSFTHDRCAAWDCEIPSGSLKQITWVACDDCDAWYHVTCSGLTAEMAKQSGTKYHCGCG